MYWPWMVRSLARLRKGKKASVRSGQGGDQGSDLLEPQRWNDGLRSGLWRKTELEGCLEEILEGGKHGRSVGNSTEERRT